MNINVGKDIVRRSIERKENKVTRLDVFFWFGITVCFVLLGLLPAETGMMIPIIWIGLLLFLLGLMQSSKSIKEFFCKKLKE
jgi:hypothetical protein